MIFSIYLDVNIRTNVNPQKFLQIIKIRVIFHMMRIQILYYKKTTYFRVALIYTAKRIVDSESVKQPRCYHY